MTLQRDGTLILRNFKKSNLPELTQDTRVFNELANFLTANYNHDYITINSIGNNKLQAIYLEAQERGLSEKELKELIHRLINTTPYPTFTIFDVFKPVAAFYKLYPYGEYLKQLQEQGERLNDEITWFNLYNKKLKRRQGFWAYNSDLTESAIKYLREKEKDNEL